MNLPEKRREPGRSPALSPKQLLAILTPIAAVAAVVVALVSSGDNPNENASSAGAGAATAERQAEDSAAPKAVATFGSVAGPADQVAAELRSKGIDAKALNNRVEVRNATRLQVDKALGDRRAGRVEIVLVP